MPDVRAGLPDSDQLVGLEAEPPLRVGQTVIQRGLRVVARRGLVAGVHRLKEEALEGEAGEALRLRLGLPLRVDQLELVAAGEHEASPRLWADAHMIESAGRRL